MRLKGKGIAAAGRNASGEAGRGGRGSAGRGRPPAAGRGAGSRGRSSGVKPARGAAPVSGKAKVAIRGGARGDGDGPAPIGDVARDATGPAPIKPGRKVVTLPGYKKAVSKAKAKTVASKPRSKGKGTLVLVGDDAAEMDASLLAVAASSFESYRRRSRAVGTSEWVVQ